MKNFKLYALPVSVILMVLFLNSWDSIFSVIVGLIVVCLAIIAQVELLKMAKECENFHKIADVFSALDSNLQGLVLKIMNNLQEASQKVKEALAVFNSAKQLFGQKTKELHILQHKVEIAMNETEEAKEAKEEAQKILITAQTDFYKIKANLE